MEPETLINLIKRQGVDVWLKSADDDLKRTLGDMTPTDKANIASKLIEAEKEWRRQLPIGERGKRLRSEDLCCPAVGLNKTYYNRILKVIELASLNSKVYGPIREEMDRTGDFNKAYFKAMDILGNKKPSYLSNVLRKLAVKKISKLKARLSEERKFKNMANILKHLEAVKRIVS
jgi:hypothetical protein